MLENLLNLSVPFFSYTLTARERPSTGELRSEAVGSDCLGPDPSNLSRLPAV